MEHRAILGFYMLRLIIGLSVLCLPFCNVLSAFWTEKQVQEYVHHSELQRRSAWQLLSKIRFNGNERVLDLGCRDGHNTAWISRLVPEGRVLGVDPSSYMVAWAKRQYHPSEFPNLHFVVANFSTPFDKKRLKEVFDVVTCFLALHLVPDKQMALERVYYFLKPGGIFVCVTPPFQTNSDYTEALQQTIESEQWQPYFKTFDSPFHFVTLDDYQNLLTQAGLEIVRCRYEPSMDPFVNSGEFISWFKACMPHIHCIPEEEQDIFIKEVLERYLCSRPSAVTDEGAICFFWGRFEIVARKREIINDYPTCSR